MNELESMDPSNPLIEAREIADTIEHLTTQLKPEVIGQHDKTRKVGFI
jgi:hypothetical protein